MQIANILSDLNSLFICENQDAALALVSPKTSSSASKTVRSSRDSGHNKSQDSIASSVKGEDDPDLVRAYALLALHKEVKEAYTEGDGARRSTDAYALRDLQQVRAEVNRVMATLESTFS